MRDVRQNGKAGKPRRSIGASKLPLGAKDLTCNEAQVEDLLAEGESTEGEGDEEGQAGKPED